MKLYTVLDYTINGYKIGYLHFSSFGGIISSILVMISKNPIVSVLFLISLFVNVSIYLILIGLNFLGISYLLVYIGAISILFLFILMLINVRVSELTTDTNNSIPLILIISVYFYEFISNVMFSLQSVDTKNNHLEENEKISDIVPTLREGNTDSTLEINDVSIIEGVQTFISQISESSSLVSPSSRINIKDYTVLELEYKEKTSNGHFINDLYESFSDKIKYITSFMWDGNLAEYSHIASIGNIMYTSHSIWLILTSIILLLAMVGSIVITIKS